MWLYNVKKHPTVSNSFNITDLLHGTRKIYLVFGIFDDSKLEFDSNNQLKIIENLLQIHIILFSKFNTIFKYKKPLL